MVNHKPTIPWENYVQLHTTNRHMRTEIHYVLLNHGFQVHWSKSSAVANSQPYLLINKKSKRAVWNTIQTEALLCEVTDDWFAQLKLLETISPAAQLELLLNPM